MPDSRAIDYGAWPMNVFALQSNALAALLLSLAVPARALATQEDFPAGGVRPLGADGEPLNLGFESGTLEDWVAEGEAFEGQPIEGDTSLPRCGAASGHLGEFWLGGYEKLEDAPLGTLTSAPFEITHPFGAFLLAGGRGQDTRVDLILTTGDVVLASFTGPSHETLQPVVVDLSASLGQHLQIRIVDNSAGSWGHVNYDDFRFFSERPEFPPGRELKARIDRIKNAGLSPEEAARAMTMAEGFRVELIAGEPDLHQPIALTLDERGRIWIAEAYSYPKRRAPEEARDRILIFEDSDGDGQFETRKVFAENLNLVSGLEVGYGGIFVGAAPELLFLADADGDDRADGPPEVLLDGWGYQDTHETLNAFIWGPDGWLYGCHGVFTHSRVGAPGTPDAERTPINAGIWRYHPLRHEFEVFAWGSSNPWGVDFDDTGRAFITACVIPHLFYTAQGGRYERQAGRHFNPYVFEDIPTIADHLHYVGSMPHEGTGISESVGGGHAHCGAMIYLGNSWPQEYRGTLLVNNVHGNRVNREILVPDGSGFVGQHGPDFLLANDGWFRGINLKYGPAGSVYLIDWYDSQACHRTEQEIWNRGNGRLFKIVYGDTQPAHADLATMDEADLVECVLHANDWHVRNARRLLGERGVSAAGRARLEQILGTHPDETRRLRALWCLHTARALAPSVLLEHLQNEHAIVRAWAVQLACEGRRPSQQVLARLEVMAVVDPSPVVRLYLACALQRMPLSRRWNLARALVSHAEDAQDPNIPFLLWYGIEPLVAANPSYAMELARASQLPRVASWIWRRAAAQDGTLPFVLDDLARSPGLVRQELILDAVLLALDTRRGVEMPDNWPAMSDGFRNSASQAVRTRAMSLASLFGDPGSFPFLRVQVADATATPEDRTRALDTLVRAKDEGVVPVLIALIGDAEWSSSALKGLAVFAHESIPGAILDALPGLRGQPRRDAITALTGRSPWAMQLLNAMGEGRADRSDLGSIELRKLRALGEESIIKRLNEVWGVVREASGDAQQEVERWRGILTDERLAQADRSAGRAVFEQTCMRCHILYGKGEDLGPDLTGAGRSDLDYLLQNMLDPNALIPAEYQMTLVRTVDGRLLTGIVQAEDDETLVLRTENEEIVLGREEIEDMRTDASSMMPEGQLGTLTEEQVLALVAYLQHDAEVPLPDCP
jgi:putative membrane-bound dehydrogenase-like protein